MSVMIRLLGLTLVALAVMAASGQRIGSAQSQSADETTRSVRQMLERLPYYGVFDFMAFSIDRQIAEIRAREVTGVFGVENGLQVTRQ